MNSSSFWSLLMKNKWSTTKFRQFTWRGSKIPRPPAVIPSLWGCKALRYHFLSPLWGKHLLHPTPRQPHWGMPGRPRLPKGSCSPRPFLFPSFYSLFSVETVGSLLWTPNPGSILILGRSDLATFQVKFFSDKAAEIEGGKNLRRTLDSSWETRPSHRAVQVTLPFCLPQNTALVPLKQTTTSIHKLYL